MKNKNKDQNKFFFGDPELMQEFIDKNIKHYNDDSLIQGNYNEEAKGCFLFCSAVDETTKKEVLDKLRVKERLEQQIFLQEIIIDKYNLPAWLLYLLEAIFEELPISDAREFFKDLQSHWHCNEEGFLKNKLLLFLLTDSQHGVLQYADTDNLKKVITDVAELHRRTIGGEKISDEEWEVVRVAAATSAAATAAWAAAWAAETVAETASVVASAIAASEAGVAKWAAMKQQLFKLLDEGK